MCKDENFLVLWANKERFMGLLEDNERTGFGVLVKRVVGKEVK